ncbi:circadian-associated transcriptional repressor-like isoform X2 [Cynoglossus semilaevis]|uniref:circadian-associated transcriptional repressor-like isoform X2 n=1 Tax=Cynoglossus semilaevis TaxID=244447 RepID=UPI0007DC9864|nr:circadian-associated transcriptional repressor-like isoform X2 [Cynoglossus semilaevis]
MQSQGSTSSQPSFDSLSSSDSLLLSDSDQVEDDADVFLTDSPSTGGAAATDAGSGDVGSESPGSQWMCDGSTDKEEEEESSYGPRSGVKGGDAGLEEAGQVTKSEGDLIFAQKCAELQGFIRPLLELLNGLKKGRFERGLSSFQQSVAMDRIQRIVGVLQKPDIGGKYLNILLQVEMMLKMWFPQIPTRPASAASTLGSAPALTHQGTSTSTPPHKHRDQRHIPVKKRRLSWTGTDAPPPPSGLLRGSRSRAEGKRTKPDQE